jgi:abortive infection bacteriophage resistance protein
VLDAIERIEVAFRTGISNFMSSVATPHWYMDAGHFDGGYDHRRLLEEVMAATSFTATSGSLAHKKRDLFIQHYYRKYNDPILPPSWMIAEILPMGAWSIAYAHLADINHRKQISKPFGLHHDFLGPWLHTLTYVRNLCAHHSRVWDRTLTLKPRIAKRLTHLMTPNDRFAAQAVTIWHLLKHVEPHSDWNVRLKQLIAKYPAVTIASMGFSPGWDSDPFWM